MPDCAEIVALLSDYLDRDLPPESCAVVEAHLESCSHCGQEVENLRKTVALCREYRSESRPGPMPAARRQELKDAFRKALSGIEGR